MKTLLLTVLLLFASCIAPQPPGEGPTLPPSPTPTGEVGKQFFLAFIRTIGDAALRTKGTEALRKHAPAVIALLDADKDGQLSFAELEAAGELFLTDPKTAGAMLGALLLVQFPVK